MEEETWSRRWLEVGGGRVHFKNHYFGGGVQFSSVMIFGGVRF